MGSWCTKLSNYMGGWCLGKLNSMGGCVKKKSALFHPQVFFFWNSPYLKACKLVPTADIVKDLPTSGDGFKIDGFFNEMHEQCPLTAQ